MIKTASNPMLRDRLAAQSAAAVKQLAPPIKKLAREFGLDQRSVRRWAEEGRGNPVYPLALLTHEAARRGCGEPFAIVAHIRSVALQGMIADMTRAELVERFWALMEEETAAQALADQRQMAFRRTGDLEQLEQALLRHASLLEALAATCGELRRPPAADPRAFGGRA